MCNLHTKYLQTHRNKQVTFVQDAQMKIQSILQTNKPWASNLLDEQPRLHKHIHNTVNLHAHIAYQSYNMSLCM